MAITITRARGSAYPVGGPTRHNPCVLTGDTSYPAGGYSITAPTFGERKLEYVDVTSAANAKGARYSVKWDTENLKLRVYHVAAPSLIVEESVTVASNVGTLDRIPGYILSVNATTATSAGSKRVIPVGTTTAAGQVAVNLVTGGLTFFGTDAVTVAKVIYIPLGVGPFTEANRVVDESVTLLTAGVNLANRAALIQYVYNVTGTNLPAIQPVGESPSTGQIAIDIVNSGNTKITPNSAQNTNVAKVTYFKYTNFAQYGWTDQADITVTSNAIVFGEALDLSGNLIPAFGQVIIGETSGNANLQATMLGPSGATAANVAVFDPAKNTLSLDSGDAYATVEMPYIVLDAAMFGAGAPVEVETGRDLSMLTFQAIAVTTR